MTNIKVRSASTAGLTYTLKVDATGKALACTCLGHVHRGTCKHVTAHNSLTIPYEAYCYHCGTIAKGLTRPQAATVLGNAKTCPSCGDHGFIYRDHSAKNLVTA